MHAATLPEWAAAVGFGTGASASIAALFFLTVDADPSDFHPRRLLDTPAGDRLGVEAVNARERTQQLRRDAALWVAALLLLLTGPGAAR